MPPRGWKCHMMSCDASTPPSSEQHGITRVAGHIARRKDNLRHGRHLLMLAYAQGRSIQVKHLLRRIGFYLVALWASITLNFIIPRLAPGDPAGALMA